MNAVADVIKDRLFTAGLPHGGHHAIDKCSHIAGFAAMLRLVADLKCD
jgi:hypothetical protein